VIKAKIEKWIREQDQKGIKRKEWI